MLFKTIDTLIFRRTKHLGYLSYIDWKLSFELKMADQHNESCVVVPVTSSVIGYFVMLIHQRRLTSKIKVLAILYLSVGIEKHAVIAIDLFGCVA
jgi:hypothetical protein